MDDVIRLDSKYISLTDDELRKIIPWISASIDVGRMGYRLDLSCDELATLIIEYQINKRHKR